MDTSNMTLAPVQTSKFFRNYSDFLTNQFSAADAGGLFKSLQNSTFEFYGSFYKDFSSAIPTLLIGVNFEIFVVCSTSFEISRQNSTTPGKFYITESLQSFRPRQAILLEKFNWGKTATLDPKKWVSEKQLSLNTLSLSVNSCVNESTRLDKKINNLQSEVDSLKVRLINLEQENTHLKNVYASTAYNVQRTPGEKEASPEPTAPPQTLLETESTVPKKSKQQSEVNFS